LLRLQTLPPLVPSASDGSLSSDNESESIVSDGMVVPQGSGPGLGLGTGVTWCSSSLSVSTIWTAEVLAHIPLPIDVPIGRTARSVLATANKDVLGFCKTLRKAHQEFEHGSALTTFKDLWSAVRHLDGVPVVVKHILTLDNGFLHVSELDIEEIWASLLAHQRLPHAIPVLDVCIDKSRLGPGVRDWDTPALVFPRLLPCPILELELVENRLCVSRSGSGSRSESEPESESPWPHSGFTYRAILAITVALVEHLAGLEAIECSHLDLKPDNIVLTRYEWDKITPDDVFVIDFGTLTPFGRHLRSPVGTEGFMAGPFHRMRETGEVVVTDRSLDMESAGMVLRHLQLRGASTDIQEHEQLGELVAAMENGQSTKTVMCMVYKLCADLDMPFRPFHTC